MTTTGSAPTVTVEGLSKKFCKDLRRSLWYGVQDLVPELLAKKNGGQIRLRPFEFLALDDVSFRVHRGECLGLLGANGAGKSTLLKILNGLIRPGGGRVSVKGRLAGLIELGAGFNPILTGRENIYVNGAILGLSKRAIDLKFDQIVEFSGLDDFIDSPVQNYSSGMQVRLGFAVAVHLDPDIFLVDEVLAVGDIAFRMKCFENFLNLKRKGTTIVVVSHNIVDITRVCDRVIVLEAGKKVFEGNVSEGIAAYEQRLLLGAGAGREKAVDAPAWIAGAVLLGPEGNQQSEFRTGEDVTVEVRIACKKIVRNGRLIVHVSSPSVGVLGSFSSPHASFSFDVEPPECRIRFTIEAAPLLVGAYGLTLSLYGAGPRDFIDAVSSAAQIQIVGPPTDTFGYGVCHSVSFRHRWELMKGRQ